MKQPSKQQESIKKREIMVNQFKQRQQAIEQLKKVKNQKKDDKRG